MINEWKLLATRCNAKGIRRNVFFTQSQFTSRHQRGNMSENMITDGEEDHYLEEFFPKQVPYHLLPLIEHRIKLLCKTDATINPGEVQLINTTCIIKGKSRKKLSMFLLPYDNLPLSFESSGYIDQNYTGRVMIRLGNFTHKKIRLSAGTPIAYIAMSSFSIE